MPHTVSTAKDNSSGLNERQQRFITAYAQGQSPYEAACYAGYSQQNAKTTAGRLLKNPTILVALQTAQSAVNESQPKDTNEKQSENENLEVQHKLRAQQDSVTAALPKQEKSDIEEDITPEAIAHELAAIGFTSMNDVCTWSEDGVTLRHSDDIPSMANAAIAEVRESGTARGGVLVKLHSKLRALELLGRHLGMFSSQIGTSPNVHDGLAFEAAQALFDDKDNPLPDAILQKLNAVYGHHARRDYGKNVTRKGNDHTHSVNPEHTFTNADTFDTPQYDDDDFDDENVDAGTFNTFN